jgi:hypothetical protein
LITDNTVQTGVTVMDPMIPGVVNGTLQYMTSFGPPVWNLGQWNSQGTIYGVTPTLLASGAYNMVKSV